MKRTFLGAVAALFLVMPLSCEKEKVPEATSVATPAPVAAAASVVPAVTAAPAPAGQENDNIPVAADFEEEAEKTITKANYKTQLDTLEAELKR